MLLLHFGLIIFIETYHCNMLVKYWSRVLKFWLWKCQDGRVICTSIPKYGKGKKAGNEKGYVVGMSTCFPQPGSVKILDGETLTLEASYKNNKRHSGAMGLFYFLVAQQLPHKHV